MILRTVLFAFVAYLILLFLLLLGASWGAKVDLAYGLLGSMSLWFYGDTAWRLSLNRTHLPFSVTNNGHLWLTLLVAPVLLLMWWLWQAVPLTPAAFLTTALVVEGYVLLMAGFLRLLN